MGEGGSVGESAAGIKKVQGLWRKFRGLRSLHCRLLVLICVSPGRADGRGGVEVLVGVLCWGKGASQEDRLVGTST